LDSDGAQDKLVTSSDAVEPEKEIILSQPCDEVTTFNESEASFWMALDTRGIMIDSCIPGIEPVTNCQQDLTCSHEFKK
jgi:hypothetical protein